MKLLLPLLALFAVLGTVLGTVIAGSQEFAASGSRAPAAVDTQILPAEGRSYYLAQWEWFEDKETGEAYWRCPGGGCSGTLDLRSLPVMGTPGPSYPCDALHADGCGVFVYESPQDICAALCKWQGIDITPKDGLLSLTQLVNIESTLNLADVLTTSRIENVIAELVIYHGDATGQSRWKPLRGSPEKGTRVYLAGEEIYRAGFDSQVFQNVVDVFQADYRRHKEAGTDLDTLQKYTGWMMEAYDATEEELLPEEHLSDGSKSPETTITESFDTADSDTLGPDLTWTEIIGDIDVVSNVASHISTGIRSQARADSDLSSDDHYAQIDVVTHNNNPAVVTGSAARFQSADATTQTFYTMAGVKLSGSGTQDVRLRKIVSSTITDIGGPTTRTLTPPYTLKTEADGSTIKGYLDSTEEFSVTDSAITGNLRTGISGFIDGAAGDVEHDNFEAADLAAAPEARKRVLIISKALRESLLTAMAVAR